MLTARHYGIPIYLRYVARSLTVWSFHPSKTPADGHHLEQTFSEALPAVWVHNIQAYGRFILLHCDDQFKVLIWDRETNGWIFVHLASLWRLKLVCNDSSLMLSYVHRVSRVTWEGKDGLALLAWMRRP